MVTAVAMKETTGSIVAQVQIEKGGQGEEKKLRVRIGPQMVVSEFVSQHRRYVDHNGMYYNVTIRIKQKI